MKLLNYSLGELIKMNTPVPPVEDNTSVSHKRPYTDCQYRIFCNLIKRKKIDKDTFYKLIYRAYNHHSIKQLNYDEMYHIIWIINHWHLKDILDMYDKEIDIYK